MDRWATSLATSRSFIPDILDGVLHPGLDRTYMPTVIADKVAGFNVGVISVPTPLEEDPPGLSCIHDAGRTAGHDASIVVHRVSWKPNIGAAWETPASPILEQLPGLVAELTTVDG
jgi:UDP-N-acetyl-D-glucosamine dehydrogenase